MEIKTGYGYRIRQKRLELGLTQEQLGEKCELSQNFLGNIERGLDTPSLTTLMKIAKGLSVNMDYLFQDEIDNPVIKEYDYYISQVISKMQEMNEKQKEYVLKTLDCKMKCAGQSE